MADIDFRRNVQILANLNAGGATNELTFNVSSFPITNPPDEVIIKQISFLNADVSTNTFCLWSDIVGANVCSFVSVNGSASVTPNTQLLLPTPLAGEYRFKVYELLGGVFAPTQDVCIITLNLEFIRYRK